ncbi:hypothetical protein ACXJJ3_22780 [Kribbella sp. WER1]
MNTSRIYSEAAPMDFQTFRAEFRRVLIAIESLDTDQLAAEAERLHELAITLEPASDRPSARRLIAPLARAVAAEQAT